MNGLLKIDLTLHGLRHTHNYVVRLVAVPTDLVAELQPARIQSDPVLHRRQDVAIRRLMTPLVELKRRYYD